MFVVLPQLNVNALHKINKYSFKSYNPESPELFQKELTLIQKVLNGIGQIQIEHAGSSAVPGLGGKGIIDIFIGCKQADMSVVSDRLKKIGFEFKPGGGGERRLFHQRLDANDQWDQVYHVHVVPVGSTEFIQVLALRDYLKSHPLEAEKYSEIKKEAAHAAEQVSDNEMKDAYMRVKEKLIQELNQKTLLWKRNKGSL